MLSEMTSTRKEKNKTKNLSVNHKNLHKQKKKGLSVVSFFPCFLKTHSPSLASFVELCLRWRINDN